MRKMKLIILSMICTLFFLPGCAIFGGDMPIRVVGSVPVQAPSDSQLGCALAMLYAESDMVASRRNVSAQFEARFIVEARSKPYYFVAKCKDGREYRSENIVAGGKGSFDKLFDLGALKSNK